MLRTIHKFFSDYQKEEVWLNEMCQQGYALKSFFPLTYKFEKCEPGEYIYRIELLPHWPSHQESQDYFEFSKELGIEVVDTSTRWVFFRKKASEGPFEIHSDKESKIKHHKSIMVLYGIVGLSNITIGISNSFIGLHSHMNQRLGLLNLALGSLLVLAAYRHFSRIKDLKT